MSDPGPEVPLGAPSVNGQKGVGTSLAQLLSDFSDLGLDVAERWVTRVGIHLRVEAFLALACATTHQHATIAVGSELIGTYRNRATVPRDMRLTSSKRPGSGSVCSSSPAPFFAQSNRHVAKMLCERAAQSVRVSLCFGEPGCQAVVIRGREEDIGYTVSAAAAPSTSATPRPRRRSGGHVPVRTAGAPSGFVG